MSDHEIHMLADRLANTCRQVDAVLERLNALLDPGKRAEAMKKIWADGSGAATGPVPCGSTVRAFAENTQRGPSPKEHQ